jgi:SAM-dependent methyltransferase
MTTPTAPTEKTFSSYTPSQGEAYAQTRPGYSPTLYKTILDQHTSTGGHLTTLLDVGCGPGTTAFQLASNFTHVIGLDPSEGMITTARSLIPSSLPTNPNPKTKIETETKTKTIRFEISTAEDLGSHLDPPVEDESVDLITASTAAHWFNMSLFWPACARVLKPGGSVAIWSSGGVGIHPDVPNSEEMQKSMDAINERELAPFFERGNVMTRELYKDLVMPWMVEPRVRAFGDGEGEVFRKLYGAEQGNEGEYVRGGRLEMDLDVMEKVLATGSPVQRWREANPEKVGTEEDVIRVMRREMERLLHEAGVEKGKERVKGTIKAILLTFKKKA